MPWDRKAEASDGNPYPRSLRSLTCISLKFSTDEIREILLIVLYLIEHHYYAVH